MGRLWSRALPLLLCCWGVAGPLVPTRGTAAPAMTPGVDACAEDGFQTRSLARSTPAGRPPPQVPTPVPASTALEDGIISPSPKPKTAEDSSEEVPATPAGGRRVASGDQAPTSPGPAGPARAPQLSTTTHEGATHCDIIDVEAAPPRVTPPAGPSPPVGRGAWPAPGTALPESSNEKSQPPRTTPTLQNRSAATATPSPPVAGPLPAESPGAGEGATVQASELAGTLRAPSMSPLRGTTDSEDSLAPAGASGAVSFPPEAGPSGARATAPAGSSATLVYSFQGRDPSPSCSPPVHLPVGRSPLPPAGSSAEPTTASAKSSSANTWGQPPTAVPTSAPRKLTPGVFPDEGAGFLLLRLTVLSSEDLLESRVVERLMQQLRCELYAHMPLTEVSLLRITRS